MRSMKYAATLAFVLALVQPAFVAAHAELVSSNPANGAVLGAVPAVVVAVYNEELKTSGPTITVTNAAGKQVDAGDGRVDLNDINHKTMLATLQPGLGAGSYTIHWKAITADDNGVTQGDITFTVQAATTSPAASTGTGTGTTAALPNTGEPADRTPWLVSLALGLGLVGCALRRRSAARS